MSMKRNIYFIICIGQMNSLYNKKAKSAKCLNLIIWSILAYAFSIFDSTSKAVEGIILITISLSIAV